MTLGTIGSTEPEQEHGDGPAAGTTGLGTGAVVALGATVFVAVLKTVAGWSLFHATGDYLDLVDVTQLPDRLDQAVAFHDAITALYGCVVLICAAVFLAWFRRARLLAPGPHRHGPGWATGAWFLPGVWWFLPRRIAADILGEPERGGIVDAWWACWTGFTVVTAESAILSLWTDAHTIRQLRAGAVIDMATTALGAAAAVAAVVFVRRAEARVAATASQPRPAGAA